MENMVNGVKSLLKSKYKYYRVIQQSYGCGWEDVSEYIADSRYNVLEFNDVEVLTSKFVVIRESLLKHDLREYILMGYSTRVISRRVLKLV